MRTVRRCSTTLIPHRGGLRSAIVRVKRPYISLRSHAPTPVAEEEDPADSSVASVADVTDYDPVVDMEVPSVITLAVSRQMPSEELSNVLKLPALPPVSDPSFEDILGPKLYLCSQMMDFSAGGEAARMRDEKSDALAEIQALLENQREALKMNGMLRRAIFRMIATNVLREDPVFPNAQMTSDYTLNVLEPSWAHLFICHQLLTKFVLLFPDAEYVNFAVVQHALFLTQVPDANERVHFVNFLKAYYDTHPTERLRFLKAVRDKLVMLREMRLVPFCAMPLLLCVTHIIVRGIRDLEDPFRAMVTQALLPLLSHKYLPVYYQNFKTTLMLVAGELPDLKIPILLAIQNMWPVGNGTKESYAADLLVFIASMLPPPVFSMMSTQFFLFCAKQCYSENFKLVNVILSMFLRDDMTRFLRDNSTVAIDKLYEPFHYVAKNHWCLAVREKAVLAIEKMEKVGKTDFAKKTNVIKMREETARKQAAGLLPSHHIAEDNRPLRKWTLVIKVAAANDADVNMDEKLREISHIFVLEKDISRRDISKVIPGRRLEKVKEMMVIDQVRDAATALRTARDKALGPRKSGTFVSLRPLGGTMLKGH